MDPHRITVIVYGAKGLKPKKKDKHKFSVKFGVGSNKFVTDVVEDLFNNPSWNTESEIDISDPSQPLRFVVHQKDDVLGQVEVAICDLPTFQRHRQIRVPLQPHKKCAYPEGELVYEAWVSATTDSVSIQSDGSAKKKGLSSGLKKLKGKLSHSPLLGRKNRGDGSATKADGEYRFSLANRGAVSLHDLSSFHGNMLSVASDSMNSLNSDEGEFVSHERADRRKCTSVLDVSKPSFGDMRSEEDDGTKPEINGVSPRESSVEGGVRVTIRGENLGLRKDDVVGLYICGSNCLSSLEYISSHKLICTTKPWKACTGNIVIETQSGGKAVSLVEFAFVPSRPIIEHESSPVPPSPKLSVGSVGSSPSPSLKSGRSESEQTIETVPEEPPKAPPSKPPRKLKAPTMDFESTSPDLQQRSDPFALSPPSPTTNSPTGSLKRSPQGSPKPGISPLADRKVRRPPPSPRVRHKPPPVNTQPVFTENETLEVVMTSSSENKPPASPATDPTKPVAEIKPQPNARKRNAPAPPSNRSESNSPVPSDDPNMEIINGTMGKSQFYDISFVDPHHEDDDTPAHSPPHNTESTFYFDKEHTKTQNKEEKAEKRKSQEREVIIPAPNKSTPVHKPPLPPGPSKKEFEDLKSKQKELELESHKKQEELRRWMDGYKQLQNENRSLKDENDSMKEYIERLVAQVMLRCPEVLNHDCLH